MTGTSVSVATQFVVTLHNVVSTYIKDIFYHAH